MDTVSFRWGREVRDTPIKNWTELPNACNHGEPCSLTPVHRGLTPLKSPCRLSLNDPGGSVVRRGLTPLDEGWHYSNGCPNRSRWATSERGLRRFFPRPGACAGYPNGRIANTSRSSGMPRSGFTSVNPRNPTQFEPTLSDHAVRIIDWIARLASDTAYLVFSMATTAARGACAIYGPDRASLPS